MRKWKSHYQILRIRPTDDNINTVQELLNMIGGLLLEKSQPMWKSDKIFQFNFKNYEVFTIEISYALVKTWNELKEMAWGIPSTISL